MDIETLYKKFKQSNYSVSTDTRNIKPNSIFFALKGGNFDGNKFALQAIETGCGFAVVDDKSIPHHKQIIHVENVLAALQQLANFHRKQFNIPIIGITGTNGKTTTKELLYSVLETQFKVHYTKGNLNNHIGVPLTLLEMPLNSELAIIEMGANHIGEIAELCEIAEPNYGLITNIGKAHLEGFGSVEGIKRTKSELYKWIKKVRGIIFVNKKDETLIELSESNAKKVWYQDSGVYGEIYSSSPKICLDLTIENKTSRIQTSLFGEYNLTNMVAAAAVGTEFNVSPENIKLALENYRPSNNRSQIQKTKQNNTLILDAYNANPTSTAAAVTSFNEITDESKIAILGDMLELGDNSKAEHQKIADLISEYNMKCFFIGEEYSKVSSNQQKFDSVADLNEFLQTNQITNHSILIKGSRGIQLEKCVDLL